MTRVRHLDRRRFLMGAGGAALALPMLREFAPKTARSAPGDAPKRIVVVHHFHGRMAGTGSAEVWSPRATTGALPTEGDLSPLLASIGAVRDRIVTIDGIDDLVRHTTGNADGHLSANQTALTCMTPQGQGVFAPGGASFDYAAGLLLRGSQAQRPSIIFPASPSIPERYSTLPFFGDGGTSGYAVSTNPLESLVEIFGPPMTDEPPPQKTLRDRLVGRRKSILDSVAGEFISLSKRVGAEDRAQLEQHAEFIRMVESHLDGSLTADCMRPSESNIPEFDPMGNDSGVLDPLITPWQIENLVMSLACDATRVAALHFHQTGDYATFASAFDGASPIPPEQLHTMVHESDFPSSNSAQIITQGFGEIGMFYTMLIERLAEVIDVDGTPLLDNTLVVWVSEMGYGSHLDYNIPVVLAGMPSAFEGGQGRHIVLPQRRTMGDLFTKILAMVGVPDTTFGQQGTIGDSGASDLNAWAGYPEFVHAGRPLHAGSFDV